MNRAILAGQVKRDVEYKEIASKINPGEIRGFAQFTLVTEESFDDKTRPSFHKIVVWGPDAAKVRDHVKDGDFLAVDGRINYRSYDDKEGNKRTASEINASWSGISTASKFVGATQMSGDF